MLAYQSIPAAALIFSLSLLAPAHAQAQSASNPAEATGLWLMTDYPELTEQAGANASVDLTLRNSNLPPERVEFSVEGLPDGWSWKMTGGGSSAVSAAIVGPNESRSLALDLTPPANAKEDAINFQVIGKSPDQTLTLPIAIKFTAAAPAKLTLEPELPALRGSPTSAFDFQVAIKNESPNDATVNLLSQAPDGFDVTFKEQYGTQELTSIPIKANESKSVKVSVQPPRDVQAGSYPVMVQAESPTVSAQTPLEVQVTGQPRLALSGPNDRLSGEATAGKAETFAFNVSNGGSAPAQSVGFNANAPSGWKVTFNPDTLPGLAAGQQAPVQVAITPSERAIAGDYMVNIRANGQGASSDADFRVTVTTSTMWGIAGLGIISASVLVLGFAVSRYGRR